MTNLAWQSSNIATQMLKVLDVDRSGAVSTDEMAALFNTHVAEALSPDQAAAYFTGQDRANGGSDGQLQYSELGTSGMLSPALLNAMLSELTPSASTMGSLQDFRFADGVVVNDARIQVFNLIDQDHDGGVSADELQRIGTSATANAAELVAGLDRDGDGRLSQMELTATGVLGEAHLGETLQKLRPGISGDTPSLNLAKWLLPQADADNSGDLSTEEYATFAIGRDASGQHGRPDFRRADLNGDGRVSADELSSALDGFDFAGILIPKGDAGKLLPTALKAIDASGDGALSKDELVSAFGSDGADALIKDFDKEGDGKLSLDELSAAIAQRPDYYANQGLVGTVEPTAYAGAFRSSFGTLAEKALHTLIWSVVAPTTSDSGLLQNRIHADFDKIKDMGTGPIEVPTKNYYRGQIQDMQSRIDQLKQGRAALGLPLDGSFADMVQMMEKSLEITRRSLAIAPEADGMFVLTS
jgi:Ca2+-binding EF-hand superfamily protein